jgi:RimJ/RimL family protein N-acetyltransferase
VADNPHVEALRAFQSQHDIEVIQNATNMPEQYAWADGVISAGGSTCWEWLYFDLPGAIITIADNQLPIVQALTENRKVALLLGWFWEFCAEVQGKALAGWIEAPNTVSDQNTGEELIDGFGASRVATELLEMPFFLRPALTTDCKRVWEWMNDKLVRQMSFQSDPIPWEVHREWWDWKISDSSTWLRIAENRQLGAFGVIRFEMKENTDEAVVSVALSPESRGHGLGVQVIHHATLQFLNQSGLSKVLAYTKEMNKASINAFQKAGYSSPEPTKIGVGKAFVLTFKLSK